MEKQQQHNSHKQRQKNLIYWGRIFATFDTERGLILLTNKELLKIKEGGSKTQENDKNIWKYNSMKGIGVITWKKISNL